LLGWNFTAAILISALIVLAYTFLGGLTSAIYNEVLQFFLIVMGFIPLVYLGLRDVGGWDGLKARIANDALAVQGLAWQESKRLLESVVSEVVPFDLETADHYAQIRGTFSIPPADAIHLASAAQAGTDLFLTNDKRLVGKFVPGIQFIAALGTQLF